jgi:2-polyprenyl-6-methoxyphenol hydroxylase-like FAD-dependent oxidoreductase
MNAPQYDLVTIGGGLGASALAIAVARHGARVLVLEKEKRFRDRVRGESLVPWGVAEAHELGISDVLLKTCAKEMPWVEMGWGPRNLAETTAQRMPSWSYCHPEMQSALLAEAENAGAHVRREVAVQGLELRSGEPIVIARSAAGEERISTRLVVAADGRGSAVRKWAGFASQKRFLPFHFAGVLLTGVAGRDDIVSFLFNPDLGAVAGIVPQSQQRCRAYLGYSGERRLNLQGNDKLELFLEESKRVSPIVREAYAHVEQIGPLATFETGESWVDRPYHDGVALLGDAAGTSDPSFGQGMATTLRDARVLRDALIHHSDWDQAGREYAKLHEHYFLNIYNMTGWLRTLFQDPGPDAQAIRQRAMPKIAEDPSRVPDHLFSGPDAPTDDGVRARLFGEC